MSSVGESSPMADAANARQLSPDSVAACLADPATRLATLSALDAHTGRHDAALSLAAAPALVDLQCLEASEVDHELFQRGCCLRVWSRRRRTRLL